ncbi:MAG: hypothetical protein HZC38_09060 [Chloroflexi bacterium]|nr:hypothetical protein [Chloroflexota bacterium]
MSRWWKGFIQPETLNVTTPFGGTVALSAVFIFLLIGAGEILLRIPIVESFLPTPSYGNGGPELGVKVRKLDAYIRQHGAVDCLFVGSSVVDSDVDPEVFSREYKARTGKDIVCFNFGLAGMAPSSIEITARFLIARYRPRILIYGVSMGDFSTKFSWQGVDLYSTPWTTYLTGKFSIEGWLIENSYSYRYFDSARYVWDFNYRQPFGKLGRLTASGFDRATIIVKDVGDLSYVDAEYEVHPLALNGLQRFIQLNDRETQILLFEEPVHPQAMALFGDDFYSQRFLSVVRKTIHDPNVPFIEIQNQVVIPVEGWKDPSHLNVWGAEVFSKWLSQHVADVLLQK